MVGDQGNPVPVEHVLGPDLLKFRYRDRRGYIIGKDKVNLCIYKFSGRDLLFAGMYSKYLFSNRHILPPYLS